MFSLQHFSNFITVADPESMVELKFVWKIFLIFTQNERWRFHGPKQPVSGEMQASTGLRPVRVKLKSKAAPAPSGSFRGSGFINCIMLVLEYLLRKGVLNSKPFLTAPAGPVTSHAGGR